MNVYYLGPKGSYSNFLAEKTFVNALYSLHPLASFAEIFDRVRNEEAAIGVIPVENSTTSSVHENVDLLFQGHLNIVGEGYLSIALHLLGIPGSTVDSLREIHSHPVALMQSSRFIEKNGVVPKEMASTSDAAAYILKQQDPSLGAVGGEMLVSPGNLEILEKDIGNDRSNYTRFFFISQSEALPEDGECDKMTLTFQVKHEPGALVKVLSSLSQLGSNLTKIESRPIAGRDWEYRFWIDLEVESDSDQSVMQAIQDNTLEYRILGRYPRGQVFKT